MEEQWGKKHHSSGRFYNWRLEIELKDEVYRLRPLIFGATKKAMKHHVLGCLEDESPDTIL